MRLRERTITICCVAVAAGCGLPRPGATPSPAPSDTVRYAVAFPDRAAHLAVVTAELPSRGRDTVDLMMPIWSPGYYKVENYADKVSDVSARTASGRPLAVAHPTRNHWKIATGGAPTITVQYHVLADVQFVTADWVGDSLIVLNGAPTFVTIADSVRRPAQVTLLLPAGWTSATALDSVHDNTRDHYRAADYDELVDSPIMAGELRLRSFTAGNASHAIADGGALGAWDSDRNARELAVLVEAHRRFWGALPYDHYVFLDVFRRGGGGLEHAKSTLLTSNASRAASDRAWRGWLEFVSHEYFHAMNVKRLRPVELGPFDYEGAPRTPSLWISEGLTSYYGDLLVERAGLETPADFLDAMSRLIGQLQGTPGRLVQTLSQSSLDVWTSENSAVGMDRATTVSYYTKGPVVGFLLDAAIRRATNGAKSLDDVMRLAFARYSGAHGFTPEQFAATVSEVAGTDMTAWLHRALDTTEELNYDEALDWYGLRFAGDSASSTPWALTVAPEATAAQRTHLAALLAP